MAAMVISNSKKISTNEYGTKKTYTVKSGDSLWSIAKSLGVSLDSLIAANPGIVNPNVIYPGDIINIPQQNGNDNGAEPNGEGAQVVSLINAERKARGLSPLMLSRQVEEVAAVKAKDMYDNQYFSHNSPVYGSPFDMLKAFGVPYTMAAENIARGQTSAQAVVNSWMNSAGHRANILNENYTQTGVGYYADGSGPYWVQMFIK